MKSQAKVLRDTITDENGNKRTPYARVPIRYTIKGFAEQYAQARFNEQFGNSHYFRSLPEEARADIRQTETDFIKSIFLDGVQFAIGRSRDVARNGSTNK